MHPIVPDTHLNLNNGSPSRPKDCEAHLLRVLIPSASVDPLIELPKLCQYVITLLPLRLIIRISS